MTTSVLVKRFHVPVIEQSTDGVWITTCQACSYDAGSPVIECLVQPASQPWPPFELVPYEPPPERGTAYLNRLAGQYDSRRAPEALRDELIGFIREAIRARPRSRQRIIGPSGIGHECGRWVGYALSSTEPVNPAANYYEWRSQVGTAAHTWLSDVAMSAANARYAFDRFLIEHRVTPVVIGGREIGGNGDAYDSWTATVIDWKVVGPNTLKKIKAVSKKTGKPHGASLQYRVQGMCYGRGYVLKGLPVKWVLIAYLPAAGELENGYFHLEPYDAGLAQEFVDRLAGTQALLDALPRALALQSLPTADVYCARCPFFDPDAANLERGCPGHPDRTIRKDSLLDLLPPAGE